MSAQDPPSRTNRRYEYADDQRTAAQRDRDRVLYCPRFLRLAGVTQVVSASEGRIFHNRLSHSLKVGQLARRLAEKLAKESPALVRDAGGVDPDIAEAAGFAHDLGHPPFGHVAEHTLDRLILERLADLSPASGATDAKNREGFEGNAQTFRILCRLAIHRSGYRGLNLTRASLNAVLKYPWLHSQEPYQGYGKYGAYVTEEEDFLWAREGSRPNVPSLEAQIMDLADDITYSIHDLDDFFQAGLVEPSFFRDPEWLKKYINEWRSSLSQDTEHPKKAELLKSLEDRDDVFFERWLDRFTGFLPYRDTFEGRATLQQATSGLIATFFRAVTLEPDDEGAIRVKLPEDSRAALKFFQRIVWTQVIAHPGLATQQYGLARVIEELFDTYLEAVREEVVSNRVEGILPPTFSELASDLRQEDPPDIEYRMLRLAADIVANLTDQEALIVHRRLTGAAPGSVLDIIPG